MTPTPSAPAPLRKPPGVGLLGIGWSAGRNRDIDLLRAAYAKIGQGKAENFALWEVERRRIETALLDRFQAVGLEASPFDLLDLFDRAAPAYWTNDGLGHVRLLTALLTDATRLFYDQCEYRLSHWGNVHLEFTGTTGSGKSSCAVTVADYLNPIEPSRLSEHLNFDIADLPSKLETKHPRETVIQDEFVPTGGDGGRTNQMKFDAIEDTLRASGVNLFICSPRIEERATTQARLEAIAWNPRDHWTAFMLWVKEKPRGVVSIPWCRPELWEAYQKFKENNVGRTKSGGFRDRRFTARMALRQFANPDIIAWLTETVTKPKKASFAEAVDFFSEDMMTISQTADVVNFMYAAAAAFEKVEPLLETRFGVPPNAGLRKVAATIAKRG